jgi:regulator of sigma E protease
VTLTVKSMDTNKQKTVLLSLANWQLDASHKDPLEGLGISSFIPIIPPIVGYVMDDTPAAKAGLKVNDHINSFNGKPLNDWFDLVEYVRNNPNKQLTLSLLREGQSMTLSLLIGTKDHDGKQEGFLGVRSKEVKWPEKWLRYQREGPITAIGSALRQTLGLTEATFSLVCRFISGKVALNNLSGPVGIAQGAGESGRGGIAAYLSFLAIVSISLGVLNLLPIPMLDGGHLLFYLIEAIIRRPLSDTMKSVGLYLGLGFLIVIMILAFSNDITRLSQ